MSLVVPNDRPAPHDQEDFAVPLFRRNGRQRLAGGVAQRDQLAGKKLRMVLALTDEEQPYFDDNWVAVPGGWKRCKGENFEDIDAFCRGNTTDFKPIKMPDGRICDVYPSCK